MNAAERDSNAGDDQARHAQPGTGGGPEAGPINFEAEAAKKAKLPWEARVQVVPSTWHTTPAPPQEWLLRDSRNDYEGVFPKATVGLLVAEGGAGKTTALVQLARAVATGGTWLGTFDVPGQSKGKVLLILGEDKPDDVHRKTYRAHVIVGGDDPTEGSLTVIPLAGVPCPMVEDGKDGKFLTWLRDYLKKTGPYALVVLDPLSRFGGKDVEKDNAAATRFMQACESLVGPSGGAAVLVAHHTNQMSRGGGKVDASSARGVTGLTDGARWVSSLSVERLPGAEAIVTFAVTKTNVSRVPMLLELKYADGGVLVPLDDAARVAADRARDAADPRIKKKAKAKAERDTDHAKAEAVAVAVVKENDGIGANDLRIKIKAKASVSSGVADVAVQRMLDAHRIRRTGHTRAWSYHVGVPNPQETNGKSTVGFEGSADDFINPEGT